MQTTLNYRTNRDLFSNYYLNESLPERNAWNEVSDDELREARADIMHVWEKQQDTVAERTESSLEEKFIRPIFRKLDIPFEVEETVQRGQRRPDYGFFPNEDATQYAFSRKKNDGDFYKDAVAVADAKRWGRSLDTRGSGENRRDFENPSYQIHVYLQKTQTQWAVLTNGKKWRLYYGPTSHRLDSYYEVDLPTILEKGDLEDFKYFYLFFRHGAFLEDAGGECFLDDVYDESNVFAQELGEDLQDNIYEAIKVLSEGFIQYSDNNLSEDNLDLIHDSSLIYLYRLIFVLYAESEGRDLLDTNNEIYEESYSLNTIKQDVVEELDSPSPKYLDWRTNLWDLLDELFKLIDQGSKSQGIPKEKLYIPAYNGGLFRTDPDGNDSTEAHFLANHQVGDSYLAKVIELLTRSQNDDTGGKVFVDYSSLDVRELGSIYEGLLEYQLNVADEPLTLEDGEYVSAGDDGDVIVQEGEVYLTTNSGERKATGSYYTPEYVVEYIVENTLEPLVEDIRMDLAGQSARGEDRGFAAEFADRVFDLRILDPAMGSGHFLTSAIDYLAREIIDAQEKQAEQQGIESVNESHDINWARRKVAQRCIYGVDLNPLAVELSKVSLWLRTLAAEQPLAFLDHHLKTGNSLVGSDIETVLDNDSNQQSGQTEIFDWMGQARQQALQHVMNRFSNLLNIDNETLSDIKEMEEVYEEVREDSLYQRLLAMVNVHTASKFDLDIPDDAEKQVAEALRDNAWEEVENKNWFKKAQSLADEKKYFHWELEFPAAFYDNNGERLSNSGFDAVIGNPPYLNIERIPDDHADYFRRGEYSSAHRRFDAYVLFAERALELTKNKGHHSYIVPDKFLSETYASKLRQEVLENHVLDRIFDLREVNVFEDATNSPIVYVVNKDVEADVTIVDSLNEEEEVVVNNELPTNDFKDIDEYRIRLDWSVSTKEIVETMTSDSIPASRVLYVSWGAQPGNADKFFRYGSKPNSDSARKMIKGGDVDRYSIDFSESYILYNPDELHRPAFPELFESPKLVFREVAGSRGLIGSFDDEAYYTDHSLSNCVLKSTLQAVDKETLSERGIKFTDKSRDPSSDSGEKVYDRDSVIYPEDLELSKQFSLKSILGIFSSKLMGFYYERYVSGDLNVFPQHIRDLPLPIIDFDARGNGLDNGTVEKYESFDSSDLESITAQDIPNLESNGAKLHDLTIHIVEDLLKMNQESRRLNTDLEDYLGRIHQDGEKLDQIGRFQPSSGIQDTPIQGTTKDYEKLQLQDANVSMVDNSSIKISVKVRYKPENLNEHDTDRNDYTYSDYITSIELFDLSPEEVKLLQAFVPVAVQQELGGLRQSAGKTISPLDRVKNIVLPDVDDTRDEIDQYMSAVEEEERLTRGIKIAGKFIDCISYTLFGLSEDQIDTVENATVEE